MGSVTTPGRGTDVVPVTTSANETTCTEPDCHRRAYVHSSLPKISLRSRSPAANQTARHLARPSHARRALEIAAAGSHNVLMIGPPGAGKTMLARRLPGILPALTEGEALEVTAVGIQRAGRQAALDVESQQVLLDTLREGGRAGAQTAASASCGETWVTPRLSATAGWHTEVPTTFRPESSSGYLS